MKTSNEYLFSTEIVIPDDNSFNKKAEDGYNTGFVFTRIARGIMHEVRSLRIDLNKYSPSSENRRVLRKMHNEKIVFEKKSLPLVDYTWKIHKMGKEFYKVTTGEKAFSAAKIKDLFLHPDTNNFNAVYIFSKSEVQIGYAIVYEPDEHFLHYAYPFYDLAFHKSSLGIGMMSLVIQDAFEKKREYVYLGSIHNKKSLYKLQFKGLEWWDQKKKIWSTDLEELKSSLKNSL